MTNKALAKGRKERTNRFIATDMYRGLKHLAELPYKEAVERGERSPFVLFPKIDRNLYIASAKA